jgi:5-formyltetrahydrofolate cyclo-ligase
VTSDPAKDSIRRQMILRREALAPAEAAAAAQHLRGQLAKLLRQLFTEPGKLKIGAYAAIRQELDLSPAWPDLLNWPADLFFPAVRGRQETANLVYGRLPDGMEPARFLVPGRFGIAEPPPECWLTEPPTLDLVLVPGVAFDRAGGRIGWGRAFYDRLLGSLPGRPTRVGVAYDFQVQDGCLPLDEQDERMDWLLTPGGYWRIRG